MHEFKKAFSLPEILMVLGIVGTIIIVMLTIVRPTESLLKPQYMKAYNTINIAAYNAYNEAVRNNEDVLYKDGQKLCEALVKYINVIPNKGSCSNNKDNPVWGYPNLLTDENVNFVSTNNLKFWLGKPYTEFTNDGTTKRVSRIVWVDINGSRKPNSSRMVNGKYPDRVAFDINDYGEVVPLGYPKIDRRYMQAKVIYPDEEKTKATMPVTFYEAQRKAFGGVAYDYDIMSNKYDFDTVDAFIYSSPIYIGLDLPAIPQESDCVNGENGGFPRCTVEIVP